MSKSIIFLVKSFLGNFYRHLAIFFLVTLLLTLKHSLRPCFILTLASNGLSLDTLNRPDNLKWRKECFKNGPIPASFCLFSLFSRYNFNTNWKSVDGVHGIRRWGCRMVGTDETTELWRPPDLLILTITFSKTPFATRPRLAERHCHLLGKKIVN